MALTNLQLTAIMTMPALAAVLSGSMFAGSLGVQRLPGCGSGSGCDAVARGRWSKWGSLSVAGLGTLFYFLFCVAIFLQAYQLNAADIATCGTIVVALAMTAVVTAFWFIGLANNGDSPTMCILHDRPNMRSHIRLTCFTAAMVIRLFAFWAFSINRSRRLDAFHRWTTLPNAKNFRCSTIAAL